MYGDSIFKVIINSIKNFIKIIITLVAHSVTSIFGERKKEEKKEEDFEKILNNEEKKQKKKKKEEIVSDTQTGLPDTDNIKSNPHNNTTITEEELKLQKPQRLYKVYNKNNELKYLTIELLLDLLLKEELEVMYKKEKFKLKTASSNELNKVDKIKERIYPQIIENAEKEILRNSEMIRKELQESLIEDQLINPLFPNHSIKEIENHKENIKHEKKALDEEEIVIIETEEHVTNSPSLSIKEEIKNATLVGATIAAKTAIDLLSPNDIETSTKEEKTTFPRLEESTKEITIKQDSPTKTSSPEIPTEEKKKEVTETIVVEETNPTLEKEIKELQEEVVEEKEKTKEELIELKEKVEEKIKELEKESLKKEKKDDKKEEKTNKKETKIKELVTDKEIVDVSLATTALLDDATDELTKEDFEERDYDKIERQIDKMLDDITNTYLKYENTLTPKQKEKLKKEEDKLRKAKDKLYLQKNKDIEIERKHLNNDILEIEKQGLQKELKKIHDENQQEVSNELFRRIDNLEGITREQVANMDKKILLSRFRKANLALEMTSIIALPFIRNKYFFAFTIGMIVDNHFNFINAFFRRKINTYEPADLESIKRGQDALNSALDITYKNLVELNYLEQQALSRYPELAYDPRYVTQVTSLRSNLTKKYNKLMKKNETMEKYRLKTQKQVKKLNFKKRRQRIFGRNLEEEQNQGRR